MSPVTAAQVAEHDTHDYECVVCDQLIYFDDGSWWHFAPNPNHLHTARPTNDGVL